MTNIVVVEDNVDLATGLVRNLEYEGYVVEVAHDGEHGLEIVREEGPELLILDIMLPHKSGYELLAELRQSGSDVAVLLLTARDAEIDKVQGFRLGADDYVTKPFGLLELLGRVAALIRRVRAARHARPLATIVRLGDMEINLGTRQVRKRGRLVDLRPREFDLLAALIRRQGLVATKQELLSEVCGYSNDVVSRTLDSHMGELRRKLEDDPSEPRFLLTVRKSGYRLAVEHDIPA